MIMLYYIIHGMIFCVLIFMEGTVTVHFPHTDAIPSRVHRDWICVSLALWARSWLQAIKNWNRGRPGNEAIT